MMCRRCSKLFDSDEECKIGYQIVCPDCFFEDVNRDPSYSPSFRTINSVLIVQANRTEPDRE